MNTPNPLLPQGSLEAQQYQKRSATKIVVSSILAIHGVVLGGLLFLGCNPEPTDKVAKTEGFESLQPEATVTNQAGTDPFGDLLGTNSEVVVPAINTNYSDPFGAPLGTGAGTPPGSSHLGVTPGNLFGRSTSNDPFTPPGTENSPSITPLDPAPQALVSYAVLPNDNFSVIAKKHKVSVQAITAANPGVDSRKLKVGDKLNLPANVKPTMPPLPDGSPSTGGAPGPEVIYTVKSGDTLTKIARNHKVTVKELQRANGIKGSDIKVGRKLMIPPPASSAGGQ